MSEKDLKNELSDFSDRYPKLAADELFVLWFLRAFVTDDERQAAEALSGGAHDKGVDAVFIDDSTKTVFVIQGKYRRGIGVGSEKRADVLSFAQLAQQLCGEARAFKSYTDKLLPEVEERLTQARNKVIKQNYRLQLFFVTTGSCSDGLVEEAERTARQSEHRASFQVIQGRQILLLLSDYLDGVAPPVPSLDLEIETGLATGASGVLQRYDPRTEIDSWVFSMTSRSVADMYKQAGIRLFSRNVRGFLGNTQINRGMEDTLKSEPAFFWYFNNGVTIVCDDAERKSRGGRDILQVTNPQVINGQQTTRTLGRVDGHATGASVLVRVIRVPREHADAPDRFEVLVSKIVGATNWQNAIRASDLMCNDRRQIEIERQFRKLGYLYLRKRETRGEALRHRRGHHQILIKKEEIAQSVAACDLDPSVVRNEGNEGLFEDRFYTRIFPTGDPLYYLSRYWTMRLVSQYARGYPERAYAKWLVLNFIWGQINSELRGKTNATRFVSQCERDGDAVGMLTWPIEDAFRNALRFYRLNRGTGETAQDVSSFFRLKGLDKDFASFWRGGRNTHRHAYRRHLVRFQRAMREAE